MAHADNHRNFMEIAGSNPLGTIVGPLLDFVYCLVRMWLSLMDADSMLLQGAESLEASSRRTEFIAKRPFHHGVFKILPWKPKIDFFY